MDNFATHILSNPHNIDRLEHGILLPDNILVTWLPLLSINKLGTCMGLTYSSWVVQGKSRLISLDKPESFLFVLPLLERTPDAIRYELTKTIENKEDITAIDALFPFFEIVRAGFEMRSNYWCELSFAWLDTLSATQKVQLRDMLSVLGTSKWATQKLRQRAQREMKLLT